jgi:hypothetical protein
MRGIAVTPYRADADPPDLEPAEQAGVSPEKPRFVDERVVRQRVLVSPDPLIAGVLLRTSPDDAEMIAKAPRGGGRRLRALPANGVSGAWQAEFDSPVGVQKYTYQLAAGYVDGARAVAMAMEVTRQADGTYHSRFLNCGDCEGIVIDLTAPDPILHTTARPNIISLMRAQMDGTPYQLTFDGRLTRGQTLQFRTDPNAFAVTETIGSNAHADISESSEGLRPGTLIIGGSDGLESFGNYDVLVEVIRRSAANPGNAEEVTRAILDEVLLRQGGVALVVRERQAEREDRRQPDEEQAQGGRDTDHEPHRQLVASGQDREPASPGYRSDRRPARWGTGRGDRISGGGP